MMTTFIRDMSKGNLRHSWNVNIPTMIHPLKPVQTRYFLLISILFAISPKFELEQIDLEQQTLKLISSSICAPNSLNSKASVIGVRNCNVLFGHRYLSQLGINAESRRFMGAVWMNEGCKNFVEQLMNVLFINLGRDYSQL